MIPKILLQRGGTHYKKASPEPIELITAHDLNFLEGCIIKYVCRHRHKGKEEDLRKVVHCAEMLLATEYPNPTVKVPEGKEGYLYGADNFDVGLADESA